MARYRIIKKFLLAGLLSIALAGQAKALVTPAFYQSPAFSTQTGQALMWLAGQFEIHRSTNDTTPLIIIGSTSGIYALYGIVATTAQINSLLTANAVAANTISASSITTSGIRASTATIGIVVTNFLSVNGSTYTLPQTDGGTGQALITNGSRVLSFGNVSGSGASGAAFLNFFVDNANKVAISSMSVASTEFSPLFSGTSVFLRLNPNTTYWANAVLYNIHNSTVDARLLAISADTTTAYTTLNSTAISLSVLWSSVFSTWTVVQAITVSTTSTYAALNSTGVALSNYISTNNWFTALLYDYITSTGVRLSRYVTDNNASTTTLKTRLDALYSTNGTPIVLYDHGVLIGTISVVNLRDNLTALMSGTTATIIVTSTSIFTLVQSSSIIVNSSFTANGTATFNDNVFIDPAHSLGSPDYFPATVYTNDLQAIYTATRKLSINHSDLVNYPYSFSGASFAVSNDPNIATKFGAGFNLPALFYVDGGSLSVQGKNADIALGGVSFGIWMSTVVTAIGTGGPGGSGGSLYIFRNGASGVAISTINILTPGFITSVVGSSITWGLDPNTSFYILNSSKPSSGYYTFFVPSATVQDLYGSTMTASTYFKSKTLVLAVAPNSTTNIDSFTITAVAGGPPGSHSNRLEISDTWSSKIIQIKEASSLPLSGGLEVNDAFGASWNLGVSDPNNPWFFVVDGGSITAGFGGMPFPRTARYLFANGSMTVQGSNAQLTINGPTFTISSASVAGNIISTGQFVLNGGTMTSCVRMPDNTLFCGTSGISGDLTPFWNYTATDTARANAISNDTGTFRREYEVFHTTADQIISQLVASSGIVITDFNNLTYFLHDETTGTASKYRLLLSSPAVGAEVSRTRNVSSVANFVVISSHVTRDIDPQVRKLPAGEWGFTTWVNIDSLSGATQLVVTLSTCSYDLQTISEVLSATSPAIGIIGATRLDMVAIQQNDIVLSTSDRLLVQYFGQTNIALGVNETIYYQGTSRASHVDTPIGSVYKFTQLTDTPQTLIGQQGKFLSVNQDQTALVFVTSPTDVTNALTTATGTLNSQIIAVNGFANSTGTTLSNSTSTLGSQIAAVNGFANSTGTTLSNSTSTLKGRADLLSTATGQLYSTVGTPITYAGSTITAIAAGSNITLAISPGAGGSTLTITGSAGGTSAGDNFGSHVPTKAITMNGFSVLGASDVWIQNSLHVGLATGPALINIATATTGNPLYMQFSTGGPMRNYEFWGSSFVVNVATMYVRGTIVIDTSNVNGNNATYISTINFLNTTDGIGRFQMNPGLELLTSSAPNASISTITVSFSSHPYLYVVMAGSASAAIGGDIMVVFNNGLASRSPLYSLSRSTYGNTTVPIINVGSTSAVGLGLFGPDISTNTLRKVHLEVYNNKNNFPKNGTFEGSSISTATEIPSGSTGRFGWFSGEQITSISFILSGKNRGTNADGGTWVLGSAVEVYGRDD